MTGSRDVRWRIGDVVVDSLISEQPTWSVGESEELEFNVTEESVDGSVVNVRAGEFALGGALGATYGDKLPGTYGTKRFETYGGVRHRDDVYFSSGETPYGKLRDFVRYSGSATVEESIDGVPLVRETVPARSEIESFVVAIEPIGSDISWTHGAWVLVTGAEDTSTIVDERSHLTLQLDVTVLAPLSEYDTREQLADDMMPGITPE